MKGLYLRSNRVYYTPAQATVFLNGYLVEDACFISYQVLDNWEPVHGYNDVHFRDTAIGRTLVTGQLGIVYRYEGYLTRVISQAQRRASGLPQTPEEVALLRKGTARAVDDETLQQDSGMVLDMLDRAAEGGWRNGWKSYRVAADFLKSRFWGDKGTPDMTPENMTGADNAKSDSKYAADREVLDYARPSTVKSPPSLKLRIVHGPERNLSNPAFARDITWVQFRGQSYEANIEVPQGDRVLTEVYPFFARNIVPVTMR